MTTYLDLLIVVVLALAAVSLVAMTLQFLVKNRTVKRICLYIVAALGMYVGTVGWRINWMGFEFQAGLAVLLASVSAGAVVLDLVGRKNRVCSLIARIAAAAALVLGMINAFCF